MQSTDASRSGGRRLKDRLSRFLRPANSLLRSSCSSSSSTSTVITAAGITISSSSSSGTTVALLPPVELFSAALDLLLHHPPPEHKKGNKQKCSSRHTNRRHFKNVDVKGIRKLSSNPYGFTTDDGNTDGSDDRVAFSSRSLMSSDSSVFYISKQLPNNKNRHNRHLQQQTRRRRRRASSCVESCSVRDEEVWFRSLVTTEVAAEEVRKGLAVVKRSRDPYGDFRESMVEMIVERQVFAAAELEWLLQSYLSLNAPRLHPVILQAFSDIWVVLHGS